MSKKLLVASLAAVGAVWAIVFGLGQPKRVYSVSVSEFLERGMVDKTARVRGALVQGTLCKVTADCGYRFILQDAGLQLSVAYEECILPNTFRDLLGLDISVTVEGERCASCHDFTATQVIVRCPGKYEMNGVWSRPAPPIPLCQPRPRT